MNIILADFPLKTPINCKIFENKHNITNSTSCIFDGDLYIFYIENNVLYCYSKQRRRYLKTYFKGISINNIKCLSSDINISIIIEFKNQVRKFEHFTMSNLNLKQTFFGNCHQNIQYKYYQDILFAFSYFYTSNISSVQIHMWDSKTNSIRIITSGDFKKDVFSCDINKNGDVSLLTVLETNTLSCIYFNIDVVSNLIFKEFDTFPSYLSFINCKYVDNNLIVSLVSVSEDKKYNNVLVCKNLKERNEFKTILTTVDKISKVLLMSLQDDSNLSIYIYNESFKNILFCQESLDWYVGKFILKGDNIHITNWNNVQVLSEKSYGFKIINLFENNIIENFIPKVPINAIIK
jgi:hypothetical protein